MSKRKCNIYNMFFPGLLYVATLFMGIGYAAVNSIVFNISGNVFGKISSGVYIYDVVVVEDDDINTVGIINLAHQTMMSSEVVLSNIDKNSSITFQISIRNSSGIDQVFNGVDYLSDETTYSNENITFYLTGIKKGDILENGESVIFTITFYYMNKEALDNNILKSYIGFNFEKIHYVTYENFSSTINYPTYVIDGETLSVSFGILDAPIEVKKNGSILSSSDYSYNNYILTINNINGDIHIRKLSKYTIKNLVTNGSFENGLNGWNLSGASSSWGTFNTQYFGNFAAYRVASVEGANFLRQNIYWNSGHKYYFFGYGISVTRQLLVCDVTNKGGKFTVTTVPNELRKGSSIYIADFTGYNSISINYAATTDNINVDGIGLVDLTAGFGVGNEPSLQWCNANINYFDGSMVVYK